MGHETTGSSIIFLTTTNSLWLIIGLGYNWIMQGLLFFIKIFFFPLSFLCVLSLQGQPIRNVHHFYQLNIKIKSNAIAINYFINY